MAAQFDRILRYIKGFSGVWIVRHDELAQWVYDRNIREWHNRSRLLGVQICLMGLTRGVALDVSRSYDTTSTSYAQPTA